MSIFLREEQKLTGGIFTSPNGRYILDLDNMSTEGVQVKDSVKNLVLNGAQAPFDAISITGGFFTLYLNANDVSVGVKAYISVFFSKSRPDSRCQVTNAWYFKYFLQLFGSLIKIEFGLTFDVWSQLQGSEHRHILHS